MKANHMNAVQQEMIDRLIKHFESLNQPPCDQTVTWATALMSVLEREEIVIEARLMYEHPLLFTRFRREFFAQWAKR